MKRLMMVMLIGLALSATGFAQGRDGGGFPVRSDRGGRGIEGFARNRDAYGIGLGFSYAPAPRVYAPAPYVAAPYEYDPVYCPPEVGGVIVRGGFERGWRFEHRDDGRRGFRR
jgi:hypothetical protein